MRDASTRGDVSCYRACATLVTVTKVRMPHWASSRHYWSQGNSQTDLLCPRQFIKAECNDNKIIHIVDVTSERFASMLHSAHHSVPPLCRSAGKFLKAIWLDLGKFLFFPIYFTVPLSYTGFRVTSNIRRIEDDITIVTLLLFGLRRLDCQVGGQQTLVAGNVVVCLLHILLWSEVYTMYSVPSSNVITDSE